MIARLGMPQEDACLLGLSMPFAHRMPGLVVFEPPGTLDTKGAASAPPRLPAEPDGETPRGRVGLSWIGDCEPEPAAGGLPAGGAAAGPCSQGDAALFLHDPCRFGLRFPIHICRGEGCAHVSVCKMGPHLRAMGRLRDGLHRGAGGGDGRRGVGRRQRARRQVRQLHDAALGRKLSAGALLRRGGFSQPGRCCCGLCIASTARLQVLQLLSTWPMLIGRLHNCLYGARGHEESLISHENAVEMHANACQQTLVHALHT